MSTAYRNSDGSRVFMSTAYRNPDGSGLFVSIAYALGIGRQTLLSRVAPFRLGSGLLTSGKVIGAPELPTSILHFYPWPLWACRVLSSLEPSVCLSVCPSVRPSVRLSVCPYGFPRDKVHVFQPINFKLHIHIYGDM